MFKCLICDEICSSEEAFREHIDSLHDGKDRKFVSCADCGAQFRQKNQLKYVFFHFNSPFYTHFAMVVIINALNPQN